MIVFWGLGVVCPCLPVRDDIVTADYLLSVPLVIVFTPFPLPTLFSHNPHNPDNLPLLNMSCSPCSFLFLLFLPLSLSKKSRKLLKSHQFDLLLFAIARISLINEFVLLLCIFSTRFVLAAEISKPKTSIS